MFGSLSRVHFDDFLVGVGMLFKFNSSVPENRIHYKYGRVVKMEITHQKQMVHFYLKKRTKLIIPKLVNS